MKNMRPITDWAEVPVVFDMPLAARLTGLSVPCLKKRAQRGNLPGAVKFGGEWRISKDSFRNFFERAAQTDGM